MSTFKLEITGTSPTIYNELRMSSMIILKKPQDSVCMATQITNNPFVDGFSPYPHEFTITSTSLQWLKPASITGLIYDDATGCEGMVLNFLLSPNSGLADDLISKAGSYIYVGTSDLTIPTQTLTFVVRILLIDFGGTCTSHAINIIAQSL